MNRFGSFLYLVVVLVEGCVARRYRPTPSVGVAQRSASARERALDAAGQRLPLLRRGAWAHEQGRRRARRGERRRRRNARKRSRLSGDINDERDGLIRSGRGGDTANTNRDVADDGDDDDVGGGDESESESEDSENEQLFIG